MLLEFHARFTKTRLKAKLAKLKIINNNNNNNNNNMRGLITYMRSLDANLALLPSHKEMLIDSWERAVRFFRPKKIFVINTDAQTFIPSAYDILFQKKTGPFFLCSNLRPGSNVELYMCRT